MELVFVLKCPKKQNPFNFRKHTQKFDIGSYDGD